MVAVNRLQPTVLLSDLTGLEREPARDAGSAWDRKDSTSTVVVGRNQA